MNIEMRVKFQIVEVLFLEIVDNQESKMIDLGIRMRFQLHSC